MGRHRDAGGDPELLERKARLRDRIWTRFEEEGEERFPGARGRIPNFTGAEEAAERLRSTDAWGAADTVKANPDSPQWPVRQRALEDGKRVYMAVPKLAGEDPFFLLDPEEVGASPRSATSIKGATRHGRTVPLEALQPIDLVVAGCVAADSGGARLGKGGGFADLEYAAAAEAGLVDAATPVVTTVHPLQLLEEGTIPTTAHDIPLDLVVTAEQTRRTEVSRDRLPGIDWGEITEEKIRAIPLLQRLRREREATGCRGVSPGCAVRQDESTGEGT